MRYIRFWFLVFVLSFISIPAVAVEYLPSTQKYDMYLASHRTQGFKSGLIYVADDNIKNTGASRWDLQAGGRFGLINWDRDWQLGIFGSLASIYDNEHSTDNIGWDGRFGATLSHKLSAYQSVKLEYHHQSAHIGDELIERTGRSRIDYTREEFNAGYSFLPTSLLRCYMEAGWAWKLLNESLQEPGRFQAGVEYGFARERKAMNNLEWRPFLALDLEFMEERDWQADSTLHLGYYALRGTDLWRLGLEVRRGRVPLGEFSQTDETYVEVALWQSGL